MHESYNPNTYANDISVLVLSRQPVENDFLQPVCVAGQDYHGGEIGHVLGWGTLSEGNVLCLFVSCQSWVDYGNTKITSMPTCTPEDGMWLPKWRRN